MINIPLPEQVPKYGERLVIIKGGQSIALPYFYSLQDSGNISWRVDVKDKGFAHGGIAYGDRKVESKKIKVSIHIRGKSQEEHDRSFNEILSLFSGSDFLLVCGRPDRAYKVEAMTEIKSSFIPSYKERWSDVEITLLLTDPFRYAVNETTVNQIFTEKMVEEEIKFNNPSSVDVPLIFSFSPNDGVPTPDIKVYHENTGQYFTLKDALLIYPSQTIINAETGTVRRGTANSLNTFAGIFLHAEPGENTFLYTGDPVKIAITYTARWLV